MSSPSSTQPSPPFSQREHVKTRIIETLKNIRFIHIQYKHYRSFLDFELYNRINFMNEDDIYI